MSIWKEKHLAKVGRAILIQAVLQAIPIHFMSYVKIPKTICAQLNSYSKRFFGDEGGGKRGKGLID